MAGGCYPGAMWGKNSQYKGPEAGKSKLCQASVCGERPQDAVRMRVPGGRERARRRAAGSPVAENELAGRRAAAGGARYLATRASSGSAGPTESSRGGKAFGEGSPRSPHAFRSASGLPGSGERVWFMMRQSPDTPTHPLLGALGRRGGKICLRPAL
ncbi:unnamed protein product [Rangifer tarandus platyrhynchus]|uniref:Uncharacterized protein n=2 Tax=Rangifer tarandus platyrhynchus TaxID=3082113 RepID=A0ABN8ZJJ0_RANTA|nr:unnamed protein product [Rangifer tarandus platyrhynchus]CAI9706077.1 unnamed protein product [Rangifer tarandus platyrhynchus]